MTLFQSIIFGVVEGITEFLPVSSTGHLILTAKAIGLKHTDFLASFEISIQLGAILAVVVLYYKDLVLNAKILKRVITAFIPTAMIGLLFYKIIKKILLGSDQVVVWSLLIGGIILIVFELLHKEQSTDLKSMEGISYRQAFLIGVFQSLAMIPGVSRSAATIVGGLAMRMKRTTIVEFSFLLAVPTMAAATALDLMKNVMTFSSDQCVVLFIGFFISFVVAIMAIKFLLYFVKKHNFIVFGVYRIIIALIFIIMKN